MCHYGWQLYLYMKEIQGYMYALIRVTMATHIKY